MHKRYLVFGPLALITASLLVIVIYHNKTTPKEPRLLAMARFIYRDEVDMTAEPIRRQYIEHLDSLYEQYRTSNNMEAAAAVEAEIEHIGGRAVRLTNTLDRRIASGSWQLYESDRPSKTFTFNIYGTLKCSEGQSPFHSWRTGKSSLIIDDKYEFEYRKNGAGEWGFYGLNEITNLRLIPLQETRSKETPLIPKDIKR